MKYTTTVGGQTFKIEIEEEDRIIVNGQEHTISFQNIGDLSLYSLLVDNISSELFIEGPVEGQEGRYHVFIHGEMYPVQVESERSLRLNEVEQTPWIPPGETVVLRAPLAGLVAAVHVEVGQEVAYEEVLLLLELMGMENELRAPRGGRVQEIHVSPGDRVEQGQALITIV
ncbi:MAG: biotin/lipoyl-containing protein [Anaerolineae bacterium]